MITIETKLDLKKYQSFMHQAIYTKTSSMIFIAILIGLFIASIILSFNDVDNVFGFPLFVVLVYLPIRVYFSTKKSYLQNKTIQEKIIYEFSEMHIKLTGETFNNNMSWSTVYKVTELKTCFLLYYNPQIFVFLPKEAFGHQVDDFRSLLKKINIKLD